MKNNARNSLFLLIFMLLTSVSLTAFRQQQPILQTDEPDIGPFTLFLPLQMKPVPITPTPLPTLTRTPTPTRTTTTITSTPRTTTPIPGSNLVIDHNSVALFGQIPDSALPAAIQTRYLLRHASIGANISDGLSCLWGNYSRRPSSCSPFFDLKYDRHNWVFQYRGNPGWIQKVDDYVEQTNLQINNFDVFSFKFGNVDGLDGGTYPLISNPANFQTHFISKVEALEAAHPNKTFVWWTMPLDRVGFKNAMDFNIMLRAYAREHDKILFDVADITSHDPAGNLILNPDGYPFLYEGYAAELYAGHLNSAGRERVARAFWVLMARMNGWSGN